jgi:MYXO-CTERM domain-containing protein
MHLRSLGPALSLAALFLAAQARAQTSDAGGLTVAINPGATITHVLPDGTDFTRGSSLTPAGINFEDCEEDIDVVFPLLVTGTTTEASGMLLYAFAGTDCAAGGAAVEPDVAGTTCWPIVPGAISYGLGTSEEVKIRARQILAQASRTVKTTYSEVAASDDSMCHTQPTSAPLTLSVYFVLATTPALTTVGGSVSPTLGADLAAGAPPEDVVLGIGHTLLLPRWTPVNDQDIVGYNVYYLPITASAASDAGTSTLDANPDPIDASDDAGIPYSPDGFACKSPFPAGSISSATSTAAVTASDGGAETLSTTGSIAALSMQPREVKKGAYPFVDVAGATAVSATIDGLTDGIEYIVAVAATDAYGNVGELSSYDGTFGTCQYPQPVSDFWTSYGGSGGQAGGSFCSGAGSPADAGETALLLGAALIFVVRRRKKASSSPGRAARG